MHVRSCPCRLKEWIDHLLWDREGREEDIYRMKGVLSIEGSDQKHQLQVRRLRQIKQVWVWQALELVLAES